MLNASGAGFRSEEETKSLVDRISVCSNYRDELSCTPHHHAANEEIRRNAEDATIVLRGIEMISALVLACITTTQTQTVTFTHPCANSSVVLEALGPIDKLPASGRDAIAAAIKKARSGSY